MLLTPSTSEFLVAIYSKTFPVIIEILYDFTNKRHKGIRFIQKTFFLIKAHTLLNTVLHQNRMTKISYFSFSTRASTTAANHFGWRSRQEISRPNIGSSWQSKQTCSQSPLIGCQANHVKVSLVDGVTKICQLTCGSIDRESVLKTLNVTYLARDQRKAWIHVH